MITVIAKTNVNDANYDRYSSLIGQLVVASQAEQGNVSYEHYENASIPNSFVIIEQWKDRQALNAHIEADHFKVYWQEVTQLCINEPTIQMFEDSDEISYE
ncbi:monooxygenase family protein [Staphylococcus piscifermentans]|uniref:Signal transduction protein TRAP n=1 Tax=Staphylococcus piscifermentans TaxID=70258 RepID=A0A239TMH5_9STAP|nr:putative quinol monooxygenase [Staphylococcus piscifermentans]RTX84533.1 antibiotic biosynthesis monooxygenase [Staphylococcus piscifermentans]GEP84791.1 hypothetical protein SPI02_13760 [Staphylococcus piscifermentans]SNU98940.1 monooxygenase family protein [Staphylococcus piscifermentans]